MQENVELERLDIHILYFVMMTMCFVIFMYQQCMIKWKKDSGLGACGGLGIAEFQMASHPYVKKYIASYAIGSQLDNVKANFCMEQGYVLELYFEENIF